MCGSFLACSSLLMLPERERERERERKKEREIERECEDSNPIPHTTCTFSIPYRGEGAQGISHAHR